MMTAREIQTSICRRAASRSRRCRSSRGTVPMRGIAGDFYDFHVLDDGRAGVMIADVTGHGVPAALIASMVKVAFTAQRGVATEPAALLAGMNQALCAALTGQFVTAA